MSDSFFILHAKYKIEPIRDWIPGYHPIKAFNTKEKAIQAGDELKAAHPAVFEDFKVRDRRRTTE